jgi:hypothetical protein
MPLLVIISRSTEVQHRRIVRIHQLHLIPVAVDLQLARVGGALQSDGVEERSDGPVLVLPRGAGHSRDSLVFWDDALVYWDLGKLSWLFVPLDRVGAGGGEQGHGVEGV